MLKQKPIQTLIDDLKSDYWVTRSRAAEALGERGAEAKQAVLALRHALHDSHREVRRDAAEAFVKIGPDASDAVPELVVLLNDPDLRSIAHRVLTTFGHSAVSGLISALDHPDHGIHAESVLYAIGEPAIPHLTKALEAENESVRSRVVSVISSIAPRDNKEAFDAMAQVAMNANESRLNRFLAASALEKIDPAGAADVGVKEIYEAIWGRDSPPNP